ncbi:L,D-transpeptidase family protein [Erythrobacter sp. EC-HK427]|uniref:L,D-transpeptidase family protein n=1 Tax=Erythrobacter sp. EC-HK427 TaxID=2038396 RepID=UPI00125BB645|nr:L,D-transpeptidase family protein [Erythrobacter sp. EC-HK427]VVS98678.1 conserved hypothetical protein [Erythrobacter sp. EC-HK427]
MATGTKWFIAFALGMVALIGGVTFFGNPFAAAPSQAALLTTEEAAPAGATVADQSEHADDAYYGNDPVSAEERAAYEAAAENHRAVSFDENDPFVIRRVLPIDGPIRYGEWYWDDEGVPDGPLVMTVDLQARVISVFRGGYEIGAAAALLGTEAHPTPTGVFPILTKERHNVSEKYNNAPMPWTLRLTWDGIAIHGGSEVELGYASHGCIGVPDEFVSRLFDIAELGDVVIITDGVRTGVGGSLDYSVN